MIKKTIILGCVFLLLSCNEAPKKINYPVTKMGNVEEDYFGTKVKDPYRWLENDHSEETKKWIDEQIEVTNSYLTEIPFRKKVKTRFEEIMKYPKDGFPFKRENYYFKYKNNGSQNQSVLYYSKEKDGEFKELLNPNTMSKEGIISLNGYYVSEDSKYIAYSISKGGSDWRHILVRDMETGKDLDDKIDWVKFSGIAWSGNGFYYAKYPEPKKGDNLKGTNKECKIFYHKVGTSQDKDKLVFELPNPNEGMSTYKYNHTDYLIISITKSTYGNKLYVMNIKNNKIHKIIDDFNSSQSIIRVKGDNLYIVTDRNAGNKKLVVYNLKTKKQKDVIPNKDYLLAGISIFEEKIIANYTKDAKSKIEVYDLEGKYLYDVKLPIEIATVRGFGYSKGSDETYYSVTTFNTPGNTYKYNIKTNKSELYQKSKIEFNYSKYEVKQEFVTSKDGTKIPVFITHKKGLKLDGKRPTLLYAYGGFNNSLTPRFSSVGALLIENDGVYVQACLRGGGEYGKKWHEAGTKMQKQNVFDDFIASGEYLIKNKYTNSNKLAIMGGSNGGLLIGAVTNQRPDLIKVAIPQVGVMDMLRYQHFTIGRYWSADYGTSKDNKEMFEYLHKYSPIHNVKEGIDYPAIMVTTADHDDRVVPAHSFKYIAELQHKYKGNNPTIIRIDKNAGHGAGKPISKRIEEYTDILSFILYNMKEKI